MNHPTPHADLTRRPLPPEVADALQARFGERFTTSAGVREHHGRDESPFPPAPPDAVVFAHSTEGRWPRSPGCATPMACR
ncbi:hypothetical protein OJJOAM_002403 [Cupriavidus sp. H18C1]